MTMRRELTCLFFGLLLTVAVRPASSAPADSLQLATAGQLRTAVLYGSAAGYDAVQPQSRSIPLAFGLSAVVPGLGQAYNRDWVKGAVSAAIEAGLLAGYLIWNDRGAAGEEAYKEYAHAYWSPGRYASWINDYVRFLNLEHGAAIEADPVGAPSGVDFTTPEDWTAAQRQAVRAFFNEIRSVEENLFHPETGASFSHTLPYFAEQQYYELIGKYYQFAPGWVDYPAWMQEGEFTEAIDPGLTGPNGSKVNVRGRFVEYASDHAEANSLLRRASRVSAFIVLNHLVSAVDAAISAKLSNDRLSTDVTIGYGPTNEPEVLASVRWSF